MTIDRSVFIERVATLSADVLSSLKQNPALAAEIDATLGIPQPYLGSGPIKLVVLGQDPTVASVETRRRITTVLMLNETRKPLFRYINKLCTVLGISLEENVYATNVCKNFFAKCPTSSLIAKVAPEWTHVLREELAEFPNATVVSLGEPVLASLVKSDSPRKLRSYWGYETAAGGKDAFRCVSAERSTIERSFFPLPHCTTATKSFYADRLARYQQFIRASEGER